jgi:seryl-tRNA synthetase
LRGFDPEQVRDYALRMAARADALERELEEAKSQRDAARRRFGTARDDAYNQLGQRMADVLRMADNQAEKIRREAEEEAKQRVAQARQLAGQIEREAEEHASAVRSEAQEVLQKAMGDRDELLGGLSDSRDVALADLGAARDHLEGILDRLGLAMEMARSARIPSGVTVLEEAAGEVDPRPAPQLAPRVEDILVRTEGFEIMLPEFLLREVEDGTLED